MRTVYKNRIIRLETFKDKTENKERCRVVEKDVAVILAFIDEKTIIIERHYRAPIGKWVLELPAGHVEKGETPKEAAKKELYEETGYRARNIKLLYKAYVAPGLLTTMSYTYLATGLEKHEKTDRSEMLEVEEVKFSDVYAMVKSNGIVDKKTISGILYYNAFFPKQKAHALNSLAKNKYA
ncbi:NUDIX hydrolase [Candidatus Marsarchaeota archaeon]|jgi:ADP-ribose pyrophosphatase|nr:NUDIX hydrolase [Candidatus Marsarchaeota archaeon]